VQLAPGLRQKAAFGASAFSGALEVVNLRKRFGNKTVVDDVSFTMSEGEILGLIGQNGAGKSTTLHMMLGLVTPESGEVRLLGKDLFRHRAEILQEVNFASPYMGFPARLTVYQTLDIFARLYGVAAIRRRIETLLEEFGIGAQRDVAFSRLSSGQASRVGLCKALLNEPRLLLLDEPVSSLDPAAAVRVRHSLLDRQRQFGTSILMTSHNMADVETMCGRVVLLSHGRVRAAGTPLDVTRDVLGQVREAPALAEVLACAGTAGADAAR
jgi:ABC-2 type transport system ATP-binding protein